MSKLQDFFIRIGLPADTEIEPTTDFLGKVQEACVKTIPYENLDILAGKPILLDRDTLYDKVITRKRGGYCFELNAFLHFILEEMGFAVTSRLARYLRGESEIPFGRHRVIIVSLDGVDYMLDIGVGQTSPRRPLALTDGKIQEQNGETYRFERDPELGWILSDLHNGEWRRYICFTDERKLEIDFTVPSFWCEMHPDSPFNKQEMLAIKTPIGRKTLDGRTFKIFGSESAPLHIEENVGDVRLTEILEKEFGIFKVNI